MKLYEAARRRRADIGVCSVEKQLSVFKIRRVGRVEGSGIKWYVLGVPGFTRVGGGDVAAGAGDPTANRYGWD